MIWLKRFLPLVLAGLAWLTYDLITQSQLKTRVTEDRRIALVTAQVWVATVRFHDDSAQFNRYRDSILSVENLSGDLILEYLGQNENRQEELIPLARLVQKFMDSLVAVEDSLAGGPETAADTVVPGS